MGSQIGLQLGAPAARAAFKDVDVVQQTIEERGHRCGVAQAAVRSVRCQECEGPLVAAQDYLEEVFRGGLRESSACRGRARPGLARSRHSWISRGS